jgi:hypothetical protein
MAQNTEPIKLVMFQTNLYRGSAEDIWTKEKQSNKKLGKI